MIDLRPTLVFPGCHVRGGVERVVWETMRHLAPHHPVTVVASEVEADGVDNVTLRRVPAPRRAGPLTPLLWKRAATPHVPSGAGVVVSYGSNCPVGDVVVVQSVHRAWLELGRPVRYGPVEVPNLMRYALPRHQVILALEAAYFRSRRYRRVVAVSENVAADLRRLYDVPGDRIVVIPNGYAPEQCSPERSAALRDRSRAEIGLGAGDVAILLVANEWHRKGLRVLLDAVAAISGEPLHVVLVGRMPPDAHAGQIARLGLTARVHYCGATDDVARYYAAADLFVMPTQYEAFGSVVVEALASGVPVITTARAGAAVAVQPGVNGLLQDEPLDAVELAELLRRALEPGTLERWRQAAAGSVSGYEWSAIVTRMRDVLVEVAGTPNSVAASSRCRTGRWARRPSR